MGQVTARKRGKTWEYGFEGARVNGKRNRITECGFRTKAEALDAGTKAKAEYNNAGQRFIPSEISFSDYLDYWYRKYVLINNAANTINSYKNAIEKHIKPALGKYHLKSLSSDVLQDFINSLKEKGLSKNTVTCIKSCISGALNYAVSPCKYISCSPMLGVRLPAYKKEPKKEYIVNKSDYKKIVSHFPPGSNFYIPFMIGYYTGLRLNECFGLTWEDIDLKNKTLSIRRQLSHISKQWCFSSLKTTTSYRTILFGDSLHTALRAERKRQSENRLRYGEYYYKHYLVDSSIIITQDCLNINEIDFVCRQENGKLYTSESMKNAIKTIHNSLGIKEFHFHSLRHTHATILATHISNPAIVQKRLGHSDIETTMKYYVFDVEHGDQSAVNVYEEFA